MFYDAYELIALTEHFYRRKLRKTLSRIPQFEVCLLYTSHPL